MNIQQRIWAAIEKATVADWLVAVATIVIAITSFYQWRAINGQLSEMRNSSSQTERLVKSSEDSARTAQDALQLARDTAQRDQRPYIWLTNNLGQPSFVPQSGQIVWSWHITNYGRSPAYNLQIRQFSIVGTVTAPQFQKRNIGADIGPPLMPTGDQFNTVVFPPSNLTAEQFSKLLATDNAIGIRVQIEYTDGSNGKYETDFCYSRLASGALNFCRENNYVK